MSTKLQQKLPPDKPFLLLLLLHFHPVLEVDAHDTIIKNHTLVFVKYPLILNCMSHV